VHQSQAQAVTVGLRRSTAADLPWITALERHPHNLDFIGQWSDAEHLEAIEGRRGRSHWIIEREGKPAGYLIAYDARGQGAGLYVKRILVSLKNHGTGRAALALFLERHLDRAAGEFAWLNVRLGNDRAEHVYRSLGFERWTPTEEERPRFDAAAEAPSVGAFRMRLG
jgi:ribosomal protein S18 acetylase RimI-like enzyme